MVKCVFNTQMKVYKAISIFSICFRYTYVYKYISKLYVYVFIYTYYILYQTVFGFSHKLKQFGDRSI